MDEVDLGAAEPFEVVDGAAVGQRERVEDARGDRGGRLGYRLAGLGAVGADALGHVAGFGEDRRVGVDDRAQARLVGGLLDQFGEVHFEAGSAPGAHGLLEEPQSGDVAQEADRAVGAPFVGEARLQRFDAEDGAGAFGADQGPGAAGDVGGVLGLVGDGGDGGGGVVAGGGDDADSAAEAGLGGHGVGQAAQDRAGLGDLAEQFSPYAGDIAQLGRPGAGGLVDQAGGGGIARLAREGAREPVREQVRDEQHPLGGVEGLGPLGGELEDRVERLVLDAGAGEQGFGAGGGEDGLAGGAGAGVAVAHGSAQQVAACVEEGVVDRPGVDGDRCGARCGAQAVEDAVPQSDDVPVQAPGGGDGAVGEPGGLGEADPVPVPVPLDGGGHDPARGGPEVDGRECRRHRRNPCGLPESTGRWTPVVRPRSGPTSA